MRYIIHCLLEGRVAAYQKRLVSNIYQEFGLNITKEENLQTHFTIKYWFETEDMVEVERIIEEFCKKHKSQPIRVGGFGSFPPKVVFINVQLSGAAKKVFFELISELRRIKWMPWDKYDAENLHFHSTIAEECNERFDAVQEYVRGKEKYFNCKFDNITILKQVGGEKHFGRWEIHKSFSLER
ncbi:2'-5' RNA ligase family protein [Candidatus Woesearchaeota archaeon]|nr:2'-5' RNA ligase family protein [Candidatus Woesearchaeota archaeon]